LSSLPHPGVFRLRLRVLCRVDRLLRLILFAPILQIQSLLHTPRPAPELEVTSSLSSISLIQASLHHCFHDGLVPVLRPRAVACIPCGGV
jgi:hypothetical protein